MTNKPEHTPNPEHDQPGDDARFAPPVPDSANNLEPDADVIQELEQESALAELEVSEPQIDGPSEVDLDAALAAISALDDMLAEQEAAEQAELAHQQAEAQARAEQEARLQNPELFFPMPSMTTMQRGRLDSVVPAFICIGLGAWLTFALTTGSTALSPALLALLVPGSLGAIFLARWVASGRWAVGAFFFGLLFILTGGVLAYLFSAGQIVSSWPLLLVAPGLAFLITGLLNGENKWMLPGILFLVISFAALTVTNGMIPNSTLSALANLWPVAAGIVLLLTIVPVIFRRQRE